MANALAPVSTGLRPPTKFTIKPVNSEIAKRIHDKAQMANFVQGTQAYRRGGQKFRGGQGNAPLL